jgi:hypothetical protein
MHRRAEEHDIINTHFEFTLSLWGQHSGQKIRAKTQHSIASLLFLFHLLTPFLPFTRIAHPISLRVFLGIVFVAGAGGAAATVGFDGTARRARELRI